MCMRMQKARWKRPLFYFNVCTCFTCPIFSSWRMSMHAKTVCKIQYHTQVTRFWKERKYSHKLIIHSTWSNYLGIINLYNWRWVRVILLHLIWSNYTICCPVKFYCIPNLNIQSVASKGNASYGRFHSEFYTGQNQEGKARSTAILSGEHACAGSVLI